MRIRRRLEKGPVQGVDGVAPMHSLITCTYQKLFKKDASALVDHPGGALGASSNGAHGTSDVARHKPHGTSWSHRGGRVAKEAETNSSGAHQEGRNGHGDGHDAPDLHEAERTNPLLPKRRKVKSTRYAEYPVEVINVTPPSTKADKRSRNNAEEPSSKANDATDYPNAATNAKEALIASIFYVYDTLGAHGLTASEVVAIMLKQSLPGLKEGGARHTVQVANVLRRSRHFISIGNKQYLPCSVPEDSGHHPPKKQGRSHAHATIPKPPPQRQALSCKLYDGSGWFCPRDAQAGFSLCAHHLDMINRPLGLPSPTSTSAPTPAPPPTAAPPPPFASPTPTSPSQRHSGNLDESDDSDRDDDMGPALGKWGRRAGSVPSQKRKMLSLCSIK